MTPGRRKPATLRIALLVDTRHVWGRNVFSGVARYAGEHTSWSIRHRPDSPDEPPEWLGDQKFDGLIGRVRTGPVLERVQSLGCPVVNLYTALPGDVFPVVQFDDDAIGALAATHLIERGISRFAYLGGPFLWSERRKRGFERALADRGFSSSAFVIPESNRMLTTLRELDAWLRDLPKPVGIFACNDLFGTEAVNAAVGVGLSVPEQVAVVGVDNDLTLCRATEAELSSIPADPAELGYRAAKLLDALLRGEKPTSKVLLIQPHAVVIRQSTDLVASVDDEYVSTALRFIRDHATEGLDVGHVAEKVGLSRSALQQRFRRMLERSVHDEIVRVRVDRAKRLLADTELPIAVVADQAGISPQRYLNAVFKSHVGLTPARFRAQARERAGA
jgi:LacI family transcriptional regulator